MGVSFWLVPPPDQATLLRSIMPRRPEQGSLAANSYPEFHPHITLATVGSGIDLPEDILEKLTENHRPICVKFNSLTVSDHYFRSVLVTVQPTADLLALQDEIKKVLVLQQLSPTAPMFPHMSLSYIADEDAKSGERDRAAQLLRGTTVVLDSNQQTISLRCGEVCLSGFDGTEIWIVDCDGPVETWTVRGKGFLR
ncbi:hypothetical protein ID866_4319 [Astraeus odoratus]|nr:hypothetical protein ID866_4319 [Astraeus odoratus]